MLNRQMLKHLKLKLVLKCESANRCFQQEKALVEAFSKYFANFRELSMTASCVCLHIGCSAPVVQHSPDLAEAAHCTQILRPQYFIIVPRKQHKIFQNPHQEITCHVTH